MPLALVALLATAPAAAAQPISVASPTISTTVNRCSWDKPGDKPFMGDVVAAVDRYRDIPAPVRARLQARMARQAYDEIVSIGRDSIRGSASYQPDIRDMHFGNGRVCRSVNRAQWARNAQERGLVYCEASHCILVPTVCRNVSRITRTSSGPVAAGSAAVVGLPGPPARLSERPSEGPADGPTDGSMAALPAGQISANTPSADPVDAMAAVVPPLDLGLASPPGAAGAGAGAGWGGAVAFVGASIGPAGSSVALGQGGLVLAPIPAVPEPGNGLLLLSGLLALGGWACVVKARQAGPSTPVARAANTSVQRDLGAHRAGAVGAGGQGNAGAPFGDHHPLCHGPVGSDVAVGQKRLQ